jgi:hypothetical protein
VLLLVDTAGCDMEEVAEEGGDSTSNPGEAQVLCSCEILYLAFSGVWTMQEQWLLLHAQWHVGWSADSPGRVSRPPCDLQAVLAHAQALIAAGVSPADIGIITPYNAQVWQRRADTCLAYKRPSSFFRAYNGMSGRLRASWTL